MSLRNEKVSSSQVVIDKNRLAELMSIEFRHLGYLRAAEAMSLKQHKAIDERDKYRTDPSPIQAALYAYWDGYLAALKDWAEMSVRMIEQVIDAHPEHDHDRAPGRIRKGQLCLYSQRGCYCLVVNRG